MRPKWLEKWGRAEYTISRFLLKISRHRGDTGAIRKNLRDLFPRNSGCCTFPHPREPHDCSRALPVGRSDQPRKTRSTRKIQAVLRQRLFVYFASFVVGPDLILL